MKTVIIPGGTVHLREQADLSVRHRRLIEAAAVGAAPALIKLPDDPEILESTPITELGLSRSEAEALFELQDATIIATIDSWSRAEPIPTMDTIGDLDTDTYEELAKATRGLGDIITNEVSFEPGDPKAPGFEVRPTSPSDGSGAVLREDQASESTEAPEPTGTSTSSGLPSPA